MLEYCSVSPMASQRHTQWSGQTVVRDRTRDSAACRNVGIRRHAACALAAVQALPHSASAAALALCRHCRCLCLDPSQLILHHVVVQRRPFGAIHDRSCVA